MTKSAPSRTSRWEHWPAPPSPCSSSAASSPAAPPADHASDASWIANYTGHGHQIQHTATGILLVLAALSLMTFLTTIWRRIASIRPDTSPLPLVAAGTASACIAAGGVLMASVSASELCGVLPAARRRRPPAGQRRRIRARGARRHVGRRSSPSPCCASRSRATGVLGSRLALFGQVAAGLLILSLLFVPIIPLLVWAAIVGITSLRTTNATEAHPVAAPARV